MLTVRDAPKHQNLGYLGYVIWGAWPNLVVRISKSSHPQGGLVWEDDASGSQPLVSSNEDRVEHRLI
jgi:hypothetical protein